jgi:hypothetical protein
MFNNILTYVVVIASAIQAATEKVLSQFQQPPLYRLLLNFLISSCNHFVCIFVALPELLY